MSTNTRDIDVLVGMFPNLSLETIKKTFCTSNNDVSAASEVLMTLPDEKITPNQIRNMFPDLSQSVIHTVYQANNSNPEQTIDALLPISDPKEQLSEEEIRLRALLEYQSAFPSLKREFESQKESERQHNLVEDEQARLFAFYKQTVDEKVVREKELKLRDEERLQKEMRLKELQRVEAERSAMREELQREEERLARQREEEKRKAVENKRREEEKKLELALLAEKKIADLEKQYALQQVREAERLAEERRKMEKRRREDEEALEKAREQHRIDVLRQEEELQRLVEAQQREVEEARRQRELLAERDRREQQYRMEQQERERALEIERKSSRLADEELKFKDEWRIKIEAHDQEHKQREARLEEIERQMRERMLEIEEDRRIAAEMLRVQEQIKAEDDRRAAEFEEQEAKRREEEERKRNFLADSAQTSSVVEKEEPTSVTCTVNGSTISWEVRPLPSAPSTAWIGIYCHNQPDNKKHQTWFNILQYQGKGTYEAKPGRYVARIFPDRSNYEHTHCTPILTVGPEVRMWANVNVGVLNIGIGIHDLSTKCAWVGIYPETVRSNKEYTQYEKFTDDSRELTMKAPRHPGKYTARLFLVGSHNNDQARAEFTIENNDAINVEQTKITLTTEVHASFTFFCGAEPSKYDWVGLYKAGEANNKQYLFSVYTNGPKAHGTVTVPLKDIKGLAAGGVYELRFFSGSDKYNPYTTTSFVIQDN